MLVLSTAVALVAAVALLYKAPACGAANKYVFNVTYPISVLYHRFLCDSMLHSFSHSVAVCSVSFLRFTLRSADADDSDSEVEDDDDSDDGYEAYPGAQAPGIKSAAGKTKPCSDGCDRDSHSDGDSDGDSGNDEDDVDGEKDGEAESEAEDSDDKSADGAVRDRKPQSSSSASAAKKKDVPAPVSTQSGTNDGGSKALNKSKKDNKAKQGKGVVAPPVSAAAAANSDDDDDDYDEFTEGVVALARELHSEMASARAAAQKEDGDD